MAVEWYYGKDGAQRGPVSSVTLKELAASGQLQSTDLVWREGMAQWLPAKSVKSLFPPDAGTRQSQPLPSPTPASATVQPTTSDERPGILDRFLQTWQKLDGKVKAGIATGGGILLLLVLCCGVAGIFVGGGPHHHQAKEKPGRGLSSDQGSATGPTNELAVKKLSQFNGWHKNAIETLRFSPDSKYLASCSSDTVRLWEVDSGEQRREFQGHSYRLLDGSTTHGGIESCAFSPDSTSFVYSRQNENESSNASLFLVDVGTGKQKHQFTGHRAKVGAIAFSPDGKHIASGTSSFEFRGIKNILWYDGDQSIRLWDVQTGGEIRRFGQVGWVQTLAFSPDGKRLLSGHATARQPTPDKPHNKNDPLFSQCAMRLWDVSTGNEIIGFHDFQTQTLAFGPSVVGFFPDGRRAFSNDVDNVRIWDLDASTKLAQYKLEWGPSSFTADGRQLLLGSAKKDADRMKGNEAFKYEIPQIKEILLVRTEDGKEVGRWNVSSPVQTVTISPDGQYAASADKNKVITIWELPITDR